MDAAKINAIIATAFNLAAAETPELRGVYPSGMRPADAAKLPRSVQRGWCESYADRMHKLTPTERKKSGDFLFSPIEVQTAIDLLSAR